MSTGVHKGGRTRILKYGKVELVYPPGLNPIKQVELYKKLRPLIPDEYKDKIFPMPHNSVFEMVKKKKAEKQKAKKVPNKNYQRRKHQR